MIELLTGSRLHFGLMELCASADYRFAGLGLMVAEPHLRLQLMGRPQRSVPKSDGSSEQNQKLREVLRRRQQLEPCSLYPERILVPENLPLHHGLGSGTQLACALAAGLEIFDRHCRGRFMPEQSWQPVASALNKRLPNAPNRHRWQEMQTGQAACEQWLVAHTGRGQRSAIGLTGFVSGGLVLDRGFKYPMEITNASRHERQQCLATSGVAGTGEAQEFPDAKSVGEPHVEGEVLGRDLQESARRRRPESMRKTRPIETTSSQLPRAWRVITIRPRAHQLVSGVKEKRRLEELGASPNASRRSMFQLAGAVLQEAKRRDFEQFVQRLSSYLELAGGMFSSCQGGLYNGAEITEVVRSARASGLRAVGQSSWGPTVFGFCQSAAEGHAVIERLRRICPIPLTQVTVSRPMPAGAEFRMDDD